MMIRRVKAMSRLRDAIVNAGKVKPIAEKNGTKICSPADASALMQEELIDPTPDVGARKVNPDGSIARSRAVISQVSPQRMYDNRFKKQGTKGVGYDELWVVPAIDPKGYRAVVQELEDKTIPVYRITKDKDTGEFILAGKTTVDFQKFHSEFTNKLDEESMKKILPLIALENDDVSSDTIEDFFK